MKKIFISFFFLFNPFSVNFFAQVSNGISRSELINIQSAPNSYDSTEILVFNFQYNPTEESANKLDESMMKGKYVYSCKTDVQAKKSTIVIRRGTNILGLVDERYEYMQQKYFLIF